ncbi:MAG: HPr kinase/phosphorylase [Rhizobiaceae bacterium]|nr:HPr kinase/phosphorylase [Rhizobiaceae bacterium]
MQAGRLHASALIVGDRGLLVAGPSGSGKTALCLAILHHCAGTGRFARLVADDHVQLRNAGGRVIATVPDAIAGLVEIYGFRPTKIDYLGAMVVDRMIRLVPSDDAPRFSEGTSETVEGAPLPCLHLPERNAGGNVTATLAWLGAHPFAFG